MADFPSPMRIELRPRGGLVLSVYFLLGLAVQVAPAEDGIFADFTTTLGSFTCQLDYTNAPMATANFIGLAAGQRAWMDVTSGQVRTNRFYDGLTFHRVIAGFMIQGGSPNGLGTDGPGYAFPDEFTPLLRFDTNGVLAMANSGPDSNGSQWFVTVTNTPWLNDVHTIFGRVVSGMPVVYAISQVVTDANSKPLTNVVIQSVAIRRVGTAAQSFDINAQSLPVVSSQPVSITNADGALALNFTNSLNAEVFLRTSSNLIAWASSSLGLDLTPPALNTLSLTAAGLAQFQGLSRVQYASSTFAPRNLYNRTLTLLFNGGQGTLTNNFDALGGGTFTYVASGTSQGPILYYDYSQEAYRGHLWPLYCRGLLPLYLHLYFTNANRGTLGGQTSTGVGLSGSFTLSPP